MMNNLFSSEAAARIVRAVLGATRPVLVVTLIVGMAAWFYGDLALAQDNNQTFQGRRITVDDDGPADFSSLVDALAEAQSGDVIRVAPGVYEGQLLVNGKKVAIVGSGAEESVIESDDVPVIFANVSEGLLAGFTVRYTGTDPHSAVLIFSASPTLENNKITGASLSGVDVQKAGSQPLLRRNNISGNAGQGVFIHKEARAYLSNNIVAHNGRSGVEVRGPATTLLQNNLIEANSGNGVLAYLGAELEMQNNLVLRNEFHGIFVMRRDKEPESVLDLTGEQPVVEKTTALLKGNTVLFNKKLGIGVKGKETLARIERNLVIGSLSALYTDNAKGVMYERNLVTMNEFKDTYGKGLTEDESYLNINLNVQANFLVFSNAVQRLQLAIRHLEVQAEAALEGEKPEALLLDSAQNVDDLQQISLFVANTYREMGFVEGAQIRYQAVQQLGSSELAVEAEKQLAALAN